MKKFKVCITGGAGFIGSNIYRELISKGHEPFVIDDLSTGNLDNLPDAALVHVKDINEITSQDLPGVDIVFHCAALARVQMSIEEPIRYNKANVDGTLNVLEASRRAGVKRLIYSASSSAYGDTTQFPTTEKAPTNPMSPYALQKYIGELYCKQYSTLYNLETVCLRYFNVYGENMATKGAYRTAIGIFKDLHKRKKPLTITNDGDQRRDFTYVKDVVSANMLAMESDKVGNAEVFNIGNGDNYSVNEIADAFGGEKEFIGDVIEPRITLANNSKAKKVLGWKPTQDAVEWIKENK